jgi:hypothetical protein
MKIQQFGGGQASRLRPQYIGQHEAAVYTNIDNALGSLAPVKDKISTAVSVTQYHEFFIAEQTWLDAAIPTEFLEFQQSMYITDGVTAPQKYKGGVYNNLGIVKPVTKAVPTNLNAVAPITDLTMVNLVSTLGTYGTLPVSDLRYSLVNVKAGRYSGATELVANDSTTEDLRVASEVYSGNPRISAVKASVAAATGVYDRSIEFSDLKGKFEDSAILFRYFKGVWRKLHTFNTPTDVFVDANENIIANDELDIELFSTFDGTYQYVYTYYNSVDGTESAPSPVSDELEVEGGTISVTMSSTSPDSQVTHKRLYRVGGNITEFTLVVELDKAVTSYEDDLSDTEVDGRLLVSDNYYEAPIGLQFLTESFAMLFGAVGDTLQFTPISVPNAWPPEYSIAFNAPITGIGPVSNGVLVFTTYQTFLVTGTGPLSLSQQPLAGDQGCISHASIQEIGPALIWASAEGLCTSAGNAVKNITKDKLGKIALTPVDSEVTDEVYYCHNADGSTLAVDFRFNTMFKYLDLDISTISYANGSLYGWQSGILYKLFESVDNLSLTYLSPRFLEGSATEEKTYKKLHIYSKGDIILNIIINDIIVRTKSLTGEQDTQIQVPQDKQRGNFVQFSITGTGEVYEYEYIVGKSRNE